MSVPVMPDSWKPVPRERMARKLAIVLSMNILKITSVLAMLDLKESMGFVSVHSISMLKMEHAFVIPLLSQACPVEF